VTIVTVVSFKVVSSSGVAGPYGEPLSPLTSNDTRDSRHGGGRPRQKPASDKSEQTIKNRALGVTQRDG
jgi:hypothetical protein